MMLTLAEIAVSNWVLGLAVMGFFLVCLLLVLTILIQRPQGGGLAGAFGSGAGSGQTAFGAKTGDALTMFTIGVFVLYIVAAILLNLYLKPAELPTVAAAATGSLVLASAWGGAPVKIGLGSQEGNASHGITAIRSIRFASGVQTMATMRAMVYDSGWITPWPSGKTAEDLEDINVPFFVRVPATQTAARYWSVQLRDSANAAGYLDVARLIVAYGFQPTINMAYGAGIAIDTKTERVETDGGAAIFDERPTRRILTGVLEEMPESEAMDWLSKGMQLGTSRQVFVAWDPDDATYGYLRSFLATLQRPTAMEQPYLARFKNAFACIEEI